MAHLRVHTSASPMSEEKNLAECCCCFFLKMCWFFSPRKPDAVKILVVFFPNNLLETPVVSGRSLVIDLHPFTDGPPKPRGFRSAF